MPYQKAQSTDGLWWDSCGDHLSHAGKMQGFLSLEPACNVIFVVKLGLARGHVIGYCLNFITTFDWCS